MESDPPTILPCLQLGEVARLDTCVTMIDSADFHNNLASLKTYDDCTIVGTIAELMIDQVEFAGRGVQEVLLEEGLGGR